jgi:hypothetical protein
MWSKLSGIISVNFDILDQPLITYSAFDTYYRKNVAAHQLLIDFKKAYKSVRGEVL